MVSGLAKLSQHVALWYSDVEKSEKKKKKKKVIC